MAYLKSRNSLGVSVLVAGMVLAGCQTTKLGGGGSEVSGSAGDEGAKGESIQLTKCDQPLGTAALVEQQIPGLAQVGLESPVPLLRLMMAQSNCFTVVDRGQASQLMQQERALSQSGQLQAGSNVGGSQIVAAEYAITPNVIYQDEDAGGAGGGIGGLLPGIGGLVAGGLNVQDLEAQVALFLTDIRTGVQKAVAEGSAEKTDIGFGLGGFGGGLAAAGGGYASTDIGKITAAAFMDAHNNLVSQLRSETTVQPLTEAGMSAPATAVDPYSTTTNLRMRTGPGSSYGVLTVLPSGTPVTPTGAIDGDWWEVNSDLGAGWVSSKYLIENQ